MYCSVHVEDRLPGPSVRSHFWQLLVIQMALGSEHLCGMEFET